MSTVPTTPETISRALLCPLFAVTLAILLHRSGSHLQSRALHLARLGISKQQMGAVFGSFALSYALAEIPSGSMGDLWAHQRPDAIVL